MKASSIWRAAAALIVIVLAARLLAGLGAYRSMAGLIETLAAGGRAPAPSPSAAPPPAWEPWLLPESAAFPIPDAQTPPPAPVLPVEKPVTPEGLAFAPPMVLDGTNAAPDFLALLDEGWKGVLRREQAQILILHSHSCEAYTPQGEDAYEESDSFRTLDKTQSVVRVGAALAEALEGQGFSVIHDREIYDHPSYSGAYARSQEAVERWLEEYPSIRVVIDLHRDALNGYRTAYLHEGETSAQVMLLLTTGETGLYHPHWQENLKLGLELQSEMQRRYDGLARPLYLSPARYNQHLSPGYFILEVGADANTLREALLAASRFADCAGAVLAAHLE